MSVSRIAGLLAFVALSLATCARALSAQAVVNTVSGQVLDDRTDRPIPDALVRLRANGAVVGHTVTDSSGWYRFASGLPTGAAHEVVEAYAPGFVPDLQRARLTCHWVVALANERAQCSREVDVYLQRASNVSPGGPSACRVAGRVMDSSGRPRVGAQVTVSGELIGALSDEGGRFVLELVPAGMQVLTASRIGYFRHERIVPVSCGSGSELSRLTFQLFPNVIE